MDAADLLLHLLHLVLPAWGLAVMLAFVLVWRRPARSFWRTLAAHLAWLGGAGSVVLVVGLLLLGRDGGMATYAALVVVLGLLAAWRDGVYRR